MTSVERWMCAAGLLMLIIAFATSGVQEGYSLGLSACAMTWVLVSASDRRPPWV